MNESIVIADGSYDVEGGESIIVADTTGGNVAINIQPEVEEENRVLIVVQCRNDPNNTRVTSTNSPIYQPLGSLTDVRPIEIPKGGAMDQDRLIALMYVGGAWRVLDAFFSAGSG